VSTVPNFNNQRVESAADNKGVPEDASKLTERDAGAVERLQNERQIAVQSLETTYDYAKFASQKQLQLDAHLAQQAVGLMTATSVAMAVIIVGAPTILKEQMTTPYALWTTFLSIAFLVASLVCSVWAQRRLGDVVFISPADLIYDETGKNNDPAINTLTLAIYQLDDDYATSKYNYDRRNKILALATYLFLAAIAVIIFAVLFAAAAIVTVFLSNPAF